MAVEHAKPIYVHWRPMVTWLVWPACLLGIGAMVPFARSRWLAYLGLRHFWRYPPLWVSGLLGFSFCSLYWSFIPAAWVAVGGVSSEAADLRVLALGSVASILAIYCATWTVTRVRSTIRSRSGAGRNATSSESAVDVGRDADTLLNWVSDDDAIVAPAQDRFGNTAIARRIASRLASNDHSTTAVVGPLGSGKTTLANLVKYELRSVRRSETIKFVLISVWKFENAAAVNKGILDALLAALNEEVGTLGLAGLPTAYTSAISGLNESWGRLVLGLGESAGPDQLLAKLDDIAQAANIRVILWVDDLERFAGSLNRRAAREEKVAPIRGLLYLLNQRSSINVITATSTLNLRFDLTKIARYVEHLPELPPERVFDILRKFRARCIEDLASLFDPATERGRQELGKEFEDGVDFGMRLAMSRERVLSIGEALVQLSTTPRQLKFALRDCRERWVALKGEIDFDELLAMVVLKEASPDAFALVDANITSLRNGGKPDAFSPRGRDDEEPSFASRLEASLSRHHKRHASAVRYVIAFVFGSVERPGPRPDMRPQGLAVSRHVDYWSRFLASSPVSSREADQRVLGCLARGDVGELRLLLEDSTLSSAVELFGNNGRLRLDEPILHRLLTDTVRVRSEERATEWPPDVFEPNPPGLIPLWRMFNRRKESGQLDHAELLKSYRAAISQSIPKNLELAEFIEHFFITGGDTAQLIEDLDSEKKYFRELLVAAFVGQADLLAERLENAQPFLLLRLIWGLDRVRAKQFSGEPFSDWPAFANLLLDCAASRSEVMLPQIATLVVESTDMSDRTTRYSYDQGLSERLFGHARVMQLFAARESTRGATFAPYDAVKKVAQGTVQASGT